MFLPFSTNTEFPIDILLLWLYTDQVGVLCLNLEAFARLSTTKGLIIAIRGAELAYE